MARNLTSAFKTELTATKLRPVLFIQFKFDGGNLNLWTGLGSKDWNGDTYQGTGTLLSIDGSKETQDVKAEGMNFTLSGIPASIISTALNENYQQRPVKVWFGALNTDDSVVADPALHYEGRMDVMAFKEGTETATVTLSTENRLISLERPRLRQYTNQDHQKLYPDDKFFEFVEDLQDKEIILKRDRLGFNKPPFVGGGRI